MEIESPRLGIPRRPRRITSPNIRSGFKHVRLGQLCLSLAFKILLEKWKQNVFAVKISGRRSKIYAPQVIAIVPCPAAMNPGTDYQRVKNIGIILVDCAKRAERSLQVLSVKPSSDGQHSTMNISH